MDSEENNKSSPDKESHQSSPVEQNTLLINESSTEQESTTQEIGDEKSTPVPVTSSTTIISTTGTALTRTVLTTPRYGNGAEVPETSNKQKNSSECRTRNTESVSKDQEDVSDSYPHQELRKSSIVKSDSPDCSSSSESGGSTESLKMNTSLQKPLAKLREAQEDNINEYCRQPEEDQDDEQHSDGTTLKGNDTESETICGSSDSDIMERQPVPKHLKVPCEDHITEKSKSKRPNIQAFTYLEHQCSRESKNADITVDQESLCELIKINAFVKADLGSVSLILKTKMGEPSEDASMNFINQIIFSTLESVSQSLATMLRNIHIGPKTSCANENRKKYLQTNLHFNSTDESDSESHNGSEDSWSPDIPRGRGGDENEGPENAGNKHVDQQQSTDQRQGQEAGGQANPERGRVAQPTTYGAWDEFIASQEDSDSYPTSSSQSPGHFVAFIPELEIFQEIPPTIASGSSGSSSYPPGTGSFGSFQQAPDFSFGSPQQAPEFSFPTTESPPADPPHPAQLLFSPPQFECTLTEPTPPSPAKSPSSPVESPCVHKVVGSSSIDDVSSIPYDSDENTRVCIDLAKKVRLASPEPDISSTDSDSLHARNKKKFGTKKPADEEADIPKTKGKYTGRTIRKKGRPTAELHKVDESTQIPSTPSTSKADEEVAAGTTEILTRLRRAVAEGETVPIATRSRDNTETSSVATSQIQASPKQELSLSKSETISQLTSISKTHKGAVTRSQSDFPKQESSEKKTSTIAVSEKEISSSQGAIKKIPVKDSEKTAKGQTGKREVSQLSGRRSFEMPVASAGLAVSKRRISEPHTSSPIPVKSTKAVPKEARQTKAREQLPKTSPKRAAPKSADDKDIPLKYPKSEKKSPQKPDKKECSQYATRSKTAGSEFESVSRIPRRFSLETKKADTQEEKKRKSLESGLQETAQSRRQGLRERSSSDLPDYGLCFRGPRTQKGEDSDLSRSFREMTSTVGKKGKKGKKENESSDDDQ